MRTDHEVCEMVCVDRLREFLKKEGLSIWGQLTEQGWVNVHCEKCRCTHEVHLRRIR